MSMFASVTTGEAVRHEKARGKRVDKPSLTRERDREFFILQLAGRSLRDIAFKYGVCHLTVRRHILAIPEPEKTRLRKQYFGR